MHLPKSQHAVGCRTTAWLQKACVFFSYDAKHTSSASDHGIQDARVEFAVPAELHEALKNMHGTVHIKRPHHYPPFDTYNMQRMSRHVKHARVSKLGVFFPTVTGQKGPPNALAPSQRSATWTIVSLCLSLSRLPRTHNAGSPGSCHTLPTPAPRGRHVLRLTSSSLPGATKPSFGVWWPTEMGIGFISGSCETGAHRQQQANGERRRARKHRHAVRMHMQQTANVPRATDE